MHYAFLVIEPMTLVLQATQAKNLAETFNTGHIFLFFFLIISLLFLFSLSITAERGAEAAS